METKNLKAAIDLMIDHEKRMNIIDLDLQFDLFLGNVSRWNAKKMTYYHRVLLILN